jgi:hypothetical protein
MQQSPEIEDVPSEYAAFIRQMPKLTSSNARRELPNFKDILYTKAKMELTHYAFEADNGVQIENFFDIGILESDAQWNARNIAQAALIPPVAANPAIGLPLAARPIPVRPADVANNAAGGAVQNFRFQFDFFKEYKILVKIYRSIILSCVDMEVYNLLKVNNSHQDISIPQYMARLHELYGIFTLEDLDACRAEINKRFSPDQSFLAQVAHMQAYFATLLQLSPANATSEADKIKSLLNNIKGLHSTHQQQLNEIIKLYQNENPALLDQEFNAMITYIQIRFRPQDITTVQDLGMVHHVATVQEALFTQAQVDQLVQAAIKAALATKSNKQEQPIKKPSGDHFCFLHGYNSSHSGNNCKVLAKYSPVSHDEMAATKPCTIHGLSSKAVGGLSSTDRDTLKSSMKSQTSK